MSETNVRTFDKKPEITISVAAATETNRKYVYMASLITTKHAISHPPI
jgi:hypothetical protein